MSSETQVFDNLILHHSGVPQVPLLGPGKARTQRNEFILSETWPENAQSSIHTLSSRAKVAAETEVEGSAVRDFSVWGEPTRRHTREEGWSAIQPAGSSRQAEGLPGRRASFSYAACADLVAGSAFMSTDPDFGE
jgi:hypothetical protein